MNDAIRKQAQEFIDNISKTDNVAIITDHDPDGFTSGTLFFDHCLKKEAKVKQFTFSRNSSELEDFPLEEFNKIITTDLAAQTIVQILEKYKGKEILFMDHHPSDAKLPDSVIEYRTMYRGYIPSARSAYELTGGKKWLALSGVISDSGHLYKENEEFIKDALDNLNMTREEFEEKIASPISDSIIYLNKEAEKSFSIIQKLESPTKLDTVEKYSKPIQEETNKIISKFESDKENIEGIIYFYFKPKYSVKPIVINKISQRKENLDKIFIFASPKDNGKVTFSARSNSGKINLATLLKAGIGNLEGKAGGHFNSSGGAVNSEDLEKFKENLCNFLKENPLD